MRVTIDTNVVFERLYSSRGASWVILQLVLHGDLSMAVSVSVFEEYKDVLLRPDTLRQLKLTESDANAFLRFVAAVAVPTATSFRWRPNLQDEADNMFVELAVASGREDLITSNTNDFTVNTDLRFDSFRVVKPRVFLSEWRKLQGE